MPALGRRPAWLDAHAHTSAESGNAFLHDVLTGLARPQKSIPPKYFYDAAGSHLFDRICDVPEYYPTRTELAILAEAAPAIAARIGPGAALIEFGAGSSVKARILLDALDAPSAYIPIDISGDHMRAAAQELARDYPDIAVVPVEADFMQKVRLPASLERRARLGFFPGSTIGNLSPDNAETFMSRAAGSLGPGAHFLVGVDLKKHGAILHAAYNDAAGVTAAFNLNLLTRINRELGGTFDLKAFRHRAYYNAARGRVEMHLESLKPQTVRVAGDNFAFREGETIHTENSYKYSVADFQNLAARTGWRPVDCFMDSEKLFSVHLLAHDAA